MTTLVNLNVAEKFAQSSSTITRLFDSVSHLPLLEKLGNPQFGVSPFRLIPFCLIPFRLTKMTYVPFRLKFRKLILKDNNCT